MLKNYYPLLFIPFLSWMNFPENLELKDKNYLIEIVGFPVFYPSRSGPGSFRVKNEIFDATFKELIKRDSNIKIEYYKVKIKFGNDKNVINKIEQNGITIINDEMTSQLTKKNYENNLNSYYNFTIPLNIVLLLFVGFLCYTQGSRRKNH